MLGGALASWLTASIAGIMISIPEVSIPEQFSDYSGKITTYDENDNEVISEGHSISFIYNHIDSKEDSLIARTKLKLVDEDAQSLELVGNCIYSSDFKTLEPCMFKKDKVLYDNTSYLIELNFLSSEENDYWNIISYEKNETSFNPITKRIGGETKIEKEKK